MCQEYHRGDVVITTDKSALDLKVIKTALQRIYWADKLPTDVIKKAIKNSVCFGMYKQHQQIGFARVVTDFSTVAYVADVFILDEYQTPDLSKWLMECICSHPKLQQLKRWLLASKDGVYSRARFTPFPLPR